MKNFIFKSQLDLQKMFSIKLEAIQSELRHQRTDNVVILAMLNKLVTNQNLQTQVDEYFDQSEDTPEHEDKEPD